MNLRKYVLTHIRSYNSEGLGKLHGDKFYAEFDKQFGLKPVEVADGVESNSTSILGGQSFLTPTPPTRPNMTGTESIFNDTTIIPSVPVDTFYTGLAGELCKSRRSIIWHNMPATSQKIQAFPHSLRVFSPVSPPTNFSLSLSTEHSEKQPPCIFRPISENGKLKLGTRGNLQSSAWRKAEYGTNICVFQERDIMYSFRAQPCRFHEFPGMYSLSTNDSRVRHSLNDE